MDAFYIGLAVGLAAALFMEEGEKKCACGGSSLLDAVAKRSLAAGAGAGGVPPVNCCTGCKNMQKTPTLKITASPTPSLYQASTFQKPQAYDINIFGQRVAFDPSNFLTGITVPKGGLG